MGEISFRLNGQMVQVSGVDPHITLLAWLRQAGLLGSKEGCAEGECGACTVLLARPDGAGVRLEAVNSCLLLLMGLADQEVWTVEGLAQGEKLHPVQEAMLQGGSQCGYCTPGFVISMAAEYYRKGRETFDLEALSGNLCRCTGYRPIRDAALSLGRPAPDDPLARRLADPAPPLKSFRYEAGATYLRPTSLGELFQMLEAYPQARFLAGGTDLGVEVNQRFYRAETLLDLNAVPELKTLHWGSEAIEIGAGVTLSEAERWLEGRVPLLAEWFPLFASRLIRNRATLGGNLGTASPIGDSPPVLLALGAEVVLVSALGERVVKLEHFFTGYRQTVLQPGELIKGVRIPLPLAPQARFYKVAKRPLDDISTVAAAFALRLEEGRVAQLRIGLGGVAATPLRAYQTEAFLVGQPWGEPSIRKAAQVIKAEFKPIDDHRGSAAYRTAMLGNLLWKFYSETQEVTV
ncbi:xanthine dehydrogenase small subunit [Meiothermus hypogaeus]|uniref:Xanthine dehydrogenase, N-terminal subunit n=2 Tax=Meiothermus hypogaeus TaxID=884155 RepID=A0A511QZU3_9DEIN|nr:FAD binding domain-containing protein [Meiothermus hypogaeus]RIH77063.1 Carbon monoxide dehydrogenase medium chain [Meiothermus hypogaeus]GEM82878.1 xanthine dehydrogenase, N-terminal subunit [Meiothermus hypogaeus NBRC 106114]